MNNLPESAILLLDGDNGIYIPKALATMDLHYPIQNVSNENLTTLREGPDAEWYWEAWDTVLRDGIVMGEDGTRYTLHQDDDLWIIPEGAEWPEDNFSTPNDYPYGEFGADSDHDRY